MQGNNLIIVYNAKGDKILMCQRHKDPYLGLGNLPGVK